MELASFSLAWAFVAGLISFLSPCVFVLVPAFLAYLGGVNINDAKAKGFNKRIFFNTLFYVLGFTVVFTGLGILLGTTLAYANLAIRTWLARIGGALIIVFGLFLTGILKIPILEGEHKIAVKRKAGYLTSFFFGMSFAVGWTPCVGAVLGSILTLAVANPSSASVLLFTYSIGLSLPFLLVGLFYAQAASIIKLSAKYTRILSIIFGILLIIVGIMLMLNRVVMIGPITWLT